MTRVVYDCMIFLQGASNATGAAGECLRRAILGDVELCLSLAVLSEIQDVLARPKTLKKFPSLTPDVVKLFMRSIGRFAVTIPDPPKVLSLPRDPKDEKYLNLAIAANAEYLVSRDNDLLSLMNPDDPAGIAFRTACPTLRILEPAEFLTTQPII